MDITQRDHAFERCAVAHGGQLADPAYRFERLYDEVRRRGFILYPGKLTKVETFRLGCIGDVDEDDV